MRRLILLLFLVLVGCAEPSPITGGQGEIRMDMPTAEPLPIVRERDERCMDIKEIEIFQVLNDGALAFVCERKSYTDCNYGMTVAIAKPRGEDFWDKKRIKVSKNQCFMQRGVFQYVNNAGHTKTVPILRLDNAYPPASEKEAVKLVESIHADLYYNCLDDLDQEFKDTKEQNRETCSCLADLMIQKILGAYENGMEQYIQEEEFIKDLRNEVEKTCGRLPKSMKY